MSKKNFAVFALVMLFAVSAMATNFRVADQVYLPAAGKLAGASGTFISDVWIANMTTDPVSVSVIYVPNAVTTTPNIQSFNNVITLAPNERREFVDFFPTVLNLPVGFGQLIFNACRQGADCGAATQDPNGVSPNFRNIAVQSRIYSIPPNTQLSQNPPTTGQLFSGIPWYNFVSQDQAANQLDKVFILGLRNTGSVNQAGTYRGNIGFVNASQFSTTTLVAKLFAGNGTQIGSEFTVTLGPLGNAQQNLAAMFPAFVGATATNAYVTVEQRNSTPTSDAQSTCQPNGCPAFFAYGSVLDNVSGDATTLEAMYLRDLSAAAIAAIYPSGAGKTLMRRAVKQ